MSEFYRKSTEEVMKSLGVTNKGLTNDEVKKRQEQYGFNELAEGKRKSTVQVFFEQFKDFLVIILIVAALISAFLGEIESTIVIMVVVILNAILGTVQHVKAEQSLNSLKALSSPIAKVFRDGQMIEIPSREIVVGDILYLDAGDYVSADGRLIENHSLQINESSLTGESLAVTKSIEPIAEKDVSIGDKKYGLFRKLCYGWKRNRCSYCYWYENGNWENCQFARFAQEKKTPLQVSLDHFGKNLALESLSLFTYF